MKRIYTLDKAKEDIIKAKTTINWILDEIQEWDAEDMRAFSTDYLKMLRGELNNIQDELIKNPTVMAIANRAEVIRDAIGDYIIDNREERLQDEEN